MVRRSSGDDLYKYKSRLSNVVQPDERRMSDLSDWGSSVTSCVDVKVIQILISSNFCSLNFMKVLFVHEMSNKHYSGASYFGSFCHLP